MIVEVILLRRAGQPLPENDRQLAHRGLMSIHKEGTRRVARISQLDDSPNPAASPVLYDPRILQMAGNKFVIEGVEKTWEVATQKNAEVRQAWGCKVVRAP